MQENDLPADALMQFLYRAPIGLVQTALNGQIEMLNPMSAQLLMPLSRECILDNLMSWRRNCARWPASIRTCMV